MIIAIGSDHAGLDLKKELARHIESAGAEVRDFGTSGPESVDYPDFAFKVGEAVASGDCDFGVLVCSTGIGISIAANKVKGVRAGLVCDADAALQSRAHVNCNVWVKTPFEGGRHERRVRKITDYENR